MAHGFGARYDLPIPLSLYLAGAGLTVAVSFAMLAVFMRSAPVSDEHWRLDLTRTAGGRLLVAPVFPACLPHAGRRALPGRRRGRPVRRAKPAEEHRPGHGLGHLVGGHGLHLGAAGRLVGARQSARHAVRLGGGALRAPPARAQACDRTAVSGRLGAWPAVVLFLAFVWMELVWEHSDSPAYLAAAMLAYSALTWLGMLLFGRTQWLSHGEVFALVFGLLARFAPTEVRESGTGGRALNLRPYGVGLLSREPVPASMVVLVLAMLAAVCFDGFMETPLWAGILEQLRAVRTEHGGRRRRRPRVGADGRRDRRSAAVCRRLPGLLPAHRLVRRRAHSGRAHRGPVRADAGADSDRLPPRALPLVSRRWPGNT